MLKRVLIGVLVLVALGCTKSFDYAPFVRNHLEAFWAAPENGSVLGVHLCYGERESVIAINPALTDPVRRGQTLRHELVHREQSWRYGCAVLTAMYMTPEGEALMEAEAYVRAEGLVGEQLVFQLLSYYPQVRKLTAAQLRELLMGAGLYGEAVE